jgi:hypothetical protein
LSGSPSTLDTCKLESVPFSFFFSELALINLKKAVWVIIWFNEAEEERKKKCQNNGSFKINYGKHWKLFRLLLKIIDEKRPKEETLFTFQSANR